MTQACTPSRTCRLFCSVKPPMASENTFQRSKRISLSSKILITPSAALLSANGSLLPVGFSSIAQNPTNVSILSASATATRNRIGRHAVIRALGLVVFLTRRSNARGFALSQRVVLAHQPLQFGKFAYHFGQQICFRQPCRTFCLLDISAHQRCDLCRQPLDPVDTLTLRAQFLVKHDSESNFGNRSSSFVFKSVS